MINQIKKFASRSNIAERIIFLGYCVCSLFYSLLFIVFRIFPIKQHKIVCCNMKGKRYGDNPKYILDEMIRQNLDYELVWLIKADHDNDMPAEVTRASYNPFSIAYHLSTAQIWIDSNLKAMGTLKRKKQCYIQTWHGSYGLKKIGIDSNKKNLLEIRIHQYNAGMENVMLSNSRRTTEIYRQAFGYSGKVLECGSPRNDIFFEDRKKFRAKVDIYFNSAGKKLLLYAPTYREDFSVECLQMRFERILETFSKKFGGDWILLVRLHPTNLKEAKTFIEYSDRIMNASTYNVMQELLVASDALITDYSSCMFDFA
ncbi:MAG: CDP-glycerol glycerophosphotransferase family protein, partial [Lachnospiraceae bacterium]|nr:CDP-glycerol glycerophosphotransferase family protein [Lachnospiraceae bacterium]